MRRVLFSNPYLTTVKEVKYHHKKRIKRRPKRRNKSKKKKWIKKAIRRPGALRRKFKKWFGLKKGQKISASMYRRGLARARRKKDTRTVRQINLAMNLAKMRRRKKKGKVIRGKFKRSRRKAANRKRRRR